jgi:hypothetical protein
VVTSLPVEGPTGLAAPALHETLYCARGDMENRIKEQQLGLFADRTSATTFRGNQLRLALASSYPHAARFIRIQQTLIALPLRC